MADITLSLDDTLELDEIIQEWSRTDSNLNLNGDESSFDISGLQTKTSILNPQETGEYTITINGQDLSVEVTDPNTIPDSVVQQFDASRFSAGDATWTDDVDSNDMSLTGDLQASTLSTGDPSVVGDGSDDHGLASLPAEMTGSSLNSFAIEFSLQTTDSSQSNYMGVFNGDEQQLAIAASLNASFTNTDGQIFFNLKDNNSSSLRAVPSTNPNLTDGDRHTVLWNVLDASNNNLELYIDGSSVSLNYVSQQSPTSWTSSWSYDMGYFARQKAGTIDKYLNTAFGVIRNHGISISGPTL